MNSPGGPRMLEGIRVIDMTSVVFGPLATQMLADYGAEVVKIEPPQGDVLRHAGRGRTRGMGPIFLNLNRGKKSVVLDLKLPEARAAMVQLLERADVFVHNVRRGAIARLGLGPQEVLRINPAILYCAATGFAETSALADAPAIDDVIQVASGLAALNAGGDGAPRFVPTVVADKTAGYGLAAAILAALVRRGRDGKGGVVDVPMYDTVLGYLLIEHLQGESFDPPIGGVGYVRVTAEGRRIYRAADGYLTMTPYTESQWAEFFRAVGREDMARDPRVRDAAQRNANIAALYGMIEDLAPRRPVAEWMALCRACGIPAYRVVSLGQAAADPELERSGTIVRRAHAGQGTVRMLASPGFFDGVAARAEGDAPLLGEHTAEVLRAAGLSEVQIARLGGAAATAGADAAAAQGDGP